MIKPSMLTYPPSASTEDQGTGLYPVDFLIEDVLRVGFKWFLTDPDAGAQVLSHLATPYLSGKYGQAKINEVVDYLKKYELRIVQHWSLIGEQMPCISIQLLDGGEMPERAGLADFEGQVDALNAQSEVMGRQELRYSPVSDTVHIGIHTGNTPDFCKYLYYVVIYILLLFKDDLETRGLQLGTYRATDLSRLNEYLPANVYSRFINYTVFSIARVNTGKLPIVKEFAGLSIEPPGASDSGDTIDNIQTGISLDDIQNNP